MLFILAHKNPDLFVEEEYIWNANLPETRKNEKNISKMYKIIICKSNLKKLKKKDVYE